MSHILSTAFCQLIFPPTWLGVIAVSSDFHHAGLCLKPQLFRLEAITEPQLGHIYTSWKVQFKKTKKKYTTEISKSVLGGGGLISWCVWMVETAEKKIKLFTFKLVCYANCCLNGKKKDEAKVIEGYEVIRVKW